MARDKFYAKYGKKDPFAKGGQRQPAQGRRLATKDDLNAITGPIQDVTQATSITTGVSVNARSGVITTVASTLAAGADVTFTVSNSIVKANSRIVLQMSTEGAGAFILNVQAITDGTFDIKIDNVHATAPADDTLNIHFQVFDG